MAAWPSTLPAPAASSYRLEPVDQTIRTDMEAGAARVRRRTQARQDMVTLSWVFDETQMQTFRAWFDDAAGAAGGAAWFIMALRVGEGAAVSHDCRFVGPYRADYVAGSWRVTARLEVR